MYDHLSCVSHRYIDKTNRNRAQCLHHRDFKYDTDRLEQWQFSHARHVEKLLTVHVPFGEVHMRALDTPTKHHQSHKNDDFALLFRISCS